MASLADPCQLIRGKRTKAADREHNAGHDVSEFVPAFHRRGGSANRIIRTMSSTLSSASDRE